MRLRNFSRRRFLQSSLAAGALLSTGPALGFARRALPQTQNKKNVIVVGAGLAGLACAYELKLQGHEVTVLEASDRVGGRVHSFRDFIPGAVVDGGGEFIGLNHPHWLGYAKEFGLDLREWVEPEGYGHIIMLDGKRLSDAEAESYFTEMDGFQAIMTDEARNINASAPWLSARAHELDATSVKDRIQQMSGSPEAKKMFVARLEQGNVAVERMSYLSCLTWLKNGGLEKTWTDSEIFTCIQGTQALAEKFVLAMGENNVRLNTAVTQINVQSAGVSLQSARGDFFSADDIVLAIPPSTWHRLTITPKIPQNFQVQMGTALKYLAKVDKRFWLDEGVTEWARGGLITTWDGTSGQNNLPAFALTAFSAGPNAEKCLQNAGTGTNVDVFFKKEFAKYFRGIGEHFLEGKLYAHPLQTYIEAGYSFPAPGEVTTVLPNLVKPFAEHLFFAGEHTSIGFSSYMEGALESGVRVANMIGQR